MDLLGDLKEVLIDIFKQYEINIPRDQEVDNLLTCYLNLKSKLVVPFPRKVKISHDLNIKNLPIPFKQAYDFIKHKFETGQEVNPHLSKGIFNIEKSDGLLVDWGIHHLHLETQKDNEKSYFYNRSDYLLFFMLSGREVYFIQVLPHKQKHLWGYKELLRIVKRNWSFLLEPYRLPEVKSIRPILSEKEIIDARNSGSLTLTEIDGDVYFPINGGLTTAKIGIQQVRKADTLITNLRNFEERLRHQFKGLTPKKRPKIKLIRDETLLCIIKERTGEIIAYL
ncbi:hypothetical protein ACQCN2_03560 [Brevibacillus ginsengisoli]|uniref:hypothetical protein n=1 Tax=Brevibacillus ginsengisoli TaxID=363854 RepID=UPI003CED65F9